MAHEPASVSYSDAGVDIDAGERAVELMRKWVADATRPEVVGSIGGFAGLFDASLLARFDRPLLATSTDGVGTKVAIAQQLDKHDTVGLDLVAMVADDLVVCGAEPLFLTDYIACGKVIPKRIAEIVKGVAEGCTLAGCALIGGETAEHPGLLDPNQYDLAGAATGVVEASKILGMERVTDGDTVIAMASSGLHSNGYSLVRRVLFDVAGWTLDRDVEDLGRTVGEELLEPTRIYAKACLALASSIDVHAYAHVTGGGIVANLKRVVPPHLSVCLNRGSWCPPTIFKIVGQLGRVEPLELERAFNMGIGMLAIVHEQYSESAISTLGAHGVSSWIVGDVRSGDGTVSLVGSYLS